MPRERVFIVLAMLAWAPAVFVVLHALGVDVWQVRSSAVVSSLVAAVVLATSVAWWLRRHSKIVARDAAGRSLRQAEAELAELLGTLGIPPHENEDS